MFSSIESLLETLADWLVGLFGLSLMPGDLRIFDCFTGDVSGDSCGTLSRDLEPADTKTSWSFSIRANVHWLEL